MGVTGLALMAGEAGPRTPYNVMAYAVAFYNWADVYWDADPDPLASFEVYRVVSPYMASTYLAYAGTVAPGVHKFRDMYSGSELGTYDTWVYTVRAVRGVKYSQYATPSSNLAFSPQNDPRVLWSKMESLANLTTPDYSVGGVNLVGASGYLTFTAAKFGLGATLFNAGASPVVVPLNVPNTSFGNTLMPPDEGTLEFWLQYGGVAHGIRPYLLGYDGTAAAANSPFRLEIPTFENGGLDTLHYKLVFGGVEVGTYDFPDGPGNHPRDNQPHHHALTWRLLTGTQYEVKWYFDGVAILTNTIDPGVALTNFVDQWLGFQGDLSLPEGPSNPHNIGGWFDNVKIFDRAKTSYTDKDTENWPPIP